jgi:RNA polymerase primary sigma factor
MKSYCNEKCISSGLYLEQEKMQEGLGHLLEKGILNSYYPEPDMEFDQDLRSRDGRNEKMDRFNMEHGTGTEETLLEADSEVEDEFEEDHVTYYLKEISSYPLLTPEREIELAQIIRMGQDRLVQLVEEHAAREKPIRELHQKARKLLSHEEAFPGVRDKVLKLIMRSLEQAQKEYPDKPVYSSLLAQSQTIMRSIDTAKHDMVKANLRLVLSIAKRYRGRGMSFDDLIQEGNLGLLKAVGRYDHNKGNRFSTYATWWVRQSIIRGIYDKTRTIRLPVHFIELKNLFFKVFYELLKELGREPTAQEIAERADLPLEKVQMVLALASQPVSLETPIGDDEQRLGDFIEDEAATSPLEECSDKELAETTKALLSTLQPREEKILRLRFGIDGRPTETLEKIGKSFNVSKERIRQIEKKALKKLRHPLRQDLLKSFMD